MSILILDFGSQYTQLIARRLHEIGVRCAIYPYTLDEQTFLAFEAKGIILSGGPATVTQKNTPKAPDWVFQSHLPILGICYGMQTMASQLGGEVQSSAVREFGYAKVQVHDSDLLKDIPDKEEATLDVWMSHGDKVTVLPSDFQRICSTMHAPIAGMAHQTKPWYGLQFHPEVTHTKKGKEILERFALDICKAPRVWSTTNIMHQLIDSIKKQVGQDRVLLALSGGVDSSVLAALLDKAIGKQLVCIFVNTGLLRFNEVEQVNQLFKKHHKLELITLHAEERFLSALKGIDCPEEKRKIIGRTFIEVFDEQAALLKNIRWLAQGTIYSDVIESAATKTNIGKASIKSHHNVGGLPEKLNLPLLEPLRELFKDEVRLLGLELGLPPEMVFRHPFPGPGLGVRILGAIKKEYTDIVRQADAIFIEELHKANLYHQVSQAFAVFLPVRSVGVMGDNRRYDFVIALRAVETTDFMTAHWAKLPHDFLSQVSNRIINEVIGVSRVVYDISGKPPATIEWE